MTQECALDIMKMGQNVFLTGNAGSGKTYVLNRYITYLKEHDIPVAITASTGIAATHIGGVTIHAWSGMGIKEILNPYEIDQLEEKQYLWDRYQKTKVLIIDEVSMISGKFLDTLDLVCRSLKRNPDEPFGGIQLVLCGDLLQLPPVNSSLDPEGESSLIIDAMAWKSSKIVSCYLTEQHRQHDHVFTQVLNAVRTGEPSYEHVDIIESRITEYDHDAHYHMTKLFTHNTDVDTINTNALNGLEGSAHEYGMTAKGKSHLIESLKKGCLAVEKLSLKLNTEVMFIKNNPDKGYVNGTRGVVVDFTDDSKPIVLTKEGDRITVAEETWSIDDEGKILASITQLPLRHAWAITVHKSQGMSLDEAVIDLSKSFTYGMGYVALSRVRSLEGLHLVGFSRESLHLNPRVLLLDQNLQVRSTQAESRITELGKSAIEKKQESFILKCGGCLEPIALKKGGGHSKKYGTFEQGNKKTYEHTYELITGGSSLSDVARERDIVIGTVIDHLAKAKEVGKDINFKHIKPEKADLKIIKEAFLHTKEKGVLTQDAKLTPVKRYLDAAGYDYSFDLIKLVRLFLKD